METLTDIENDSLVSFTVTLDGGLYNFSNLPTGDYYLVVNQPSGYGFSDAAQEPTDSLVSDVVPRIFMGNTIGVTEIISVTDTEFDYTWDIGVFPGSNIITEICGDDIDNDGDGLIDNFDPDCCGIRAPTISKRL